MSRERERERESNEKVRVEKDEMKRIVFFQESSSSIIGPKTTVLMPIPREIEFSLPALDDAVMETHLRI